MQGQQSALSGARRTVAGESWLKPQPSSPSSPRGQAALGEISRGRSPEPDPTGTEDSPLSQVSLIHSDLRQSHVLTPMYSQGRLVTLLSNHRA